MTGAMSHRGNETQRRHVKAFTYEPKIPAVLAGTCSQTIRKVGKVKVEAGDIITFHDWEGRPYWSSWTWSFEVEVSEVLKITACEGGIIVRPPGCMTTTLKKWTSPWARKLAETDGLQPPTGEELRRVLVSQMKRDEVVKQFQVIRWPGGRPMVKTTGMTQRKKTPAPKGAAKKTTTKKATTKKAPAKKEPKKGKFAGFADTRHHPRVEPVEKHLYFSKFEAGDLSATINHNDIVKLAKAIYRMSHSYMLTPAQKRQEYNKKVKALVGSKLKFEDESFLNKTTHKDFAALVDLLMKRVPYKEPYKLLNEFKHDD